jgi:hypothetical protein
MTAELQTPGVNVTKPSISVSLFRGKIQGNISDAGRSGLFRAANNGISLVYFGHFPTKRNREFLQPNREILGINRERFRLVPSDLLFREHPYLI